jgi:cell wall-associated NlpC family hydrolase
MTCTMGMSGVWAAAPAAAFTPEQNPNTTTASVSVRQPVQSMSIPADAQAASVSADTFAATSQQELDARKAAAAAAAAAAANAQAASVGNGSGLGAKILALAETYIGVVPYSTGASPSAGFECDGLVQWVYGRYGISMPRGVDNQAAMGTEVSESQAVAGDLVVYYGQHIGIYDGDGGIVDSPDWGRYVSHRAIWGSPIFIHVSGV